MVGLITLPPGLSGFYLENYNENESAWCIILVKQLMQNMNLEQKCTNGTGWLGADCGNEDFFSQNANKNEEDIWSNFWKILDTRQVLPVYVCRAATCSRSSVVWCQTAKRSTEKSTSWKITRALLYSHGYLNVTTDE